MMDETIYKKVGEGVQKKAKKMFFFANPIWVKLQNGIIKAPRTKAYKRGDKIVGAIDLGVNQHI